MKTLNDMGLERAAHIETGFHGWVADGLPIVTYDEWTSARQRCVAGRWRFASFEERLREHLRSWVGEWPRPRSGVHVVGDQARRRPTREGRGMDRPRPLADIVGSLDNACDEAYESEVPQH